jgi:hypothetical protein
MILTEIILRRMRIKVIRRNRMFRDAGMVTGSVVEFRKGSPERVHIRMMDSRTHESWVLVRIGRRSPVGIASIRAGSAMT